MVDVMGSWFKFLCGDKFRASVACCFHRSPLESAAQELPVFRYLIVWLISCIKMQGIVSCPKPWLWQTQTLWIFPSLYNRALYFLAIDLTVESVTTEVLLICFLLLNPWVSGQRKLIIQNLQKHRLQLDISLCQDEYCYTCNTIFL